MVDKKDMQENWKVDWKKQKENGTGLGGFFQGFVKTADPKWVEAWEKVMYNAVGFAYDAAHELHKASQTSEGRAELERQLASMRQSIMSDVKKGKKNPDSGEEN